MTKMCRFFYRKLVRDGTEAIVTNCGGTSVTRTLSDSEFIEELKKKLVEESVEVIQEAGATEVMHELADLVDIIEHLKAAMNITTAQLDEIRAAKTEKRGGFDKRVYMESADLPEGSRTYEYLKTQPEKYPVSS